MPKVEVRESPIQGKGLFATRDIEASDVIGEFELGPGTEKKYLWSAGRVVTNDLKYANSSMFPTKKGRRYVEDKSVTNARRNGVYLEAARDIKAGEEIFWAYIYPTE
jgi:hypothetical protein